MAQLAANFAAKDLLNLMTSRSVATDWLIITHHLILANFYSESNAQSYINIIHIYIYIAKHNIYMNNMNICIYNMNIYICTIYIYILQDIMTALTGGQCLPTKFSQKNKMLVNVNRNKPPMSDNYDF